MPATAASVRDGIRTPRRFPAAWVGLWFAALMILTLGVRIAKPTGWVGSDDNSYYSAAEHLLSGQTIHRLHHHYARMAVIVPVALSLAVFGDSAAAVAFPSLVVSTLCVVLAVIVGRMVWGWWEGLCAGTLLSVLPYFRLLSTTAYPDVHACLWATAAMVAALAIAYENRLPRMLICGVACGLMIGLAASAKLFAAVVLPAVVMVIATRGQSGLRKRVLAVSAVVAGGLIFTAIEGVFYLWAADDFFYRLHALQHIQASDQYFPERGYHEAAGWGRLLWDRLTMPRHRELSGWGTVGVFFLPAACLVLLFNRRGRPLAVWGLATYVIVAFAPVSFHHGPQPFPTFYGRHILTACIPFALCLAWLVHWGAGRVLRPSWIAGGWPVAFGGILALLYGGDESISGFRERPTKWIGQGVEQIAASTEFVDDRHIFMTPSTYWRYRVLFPADLRARLRVATDSESPDWWRDVCPNIESRLHPLPPPGEAYLIATPEQLAGRAEIWDYGVGLPVEALKPWQETVPVVSMSRRKDESIGPTDGTNRDGAVLLFYLLGESSPDDGVKVAGASE